MQVGGERLGRVGIVRVAVGQARRGVSGEVGTQWIGRDRIAVAGVERIGRHGLYGSGGRGK